MSQKSSADHDSHYIRKIKNIPILTNAEEVELAQNWKKSQDKVSADKLINAHLKLVAKIAAGYRGYGLPLSDLIAEGNFGILQALKHYDPEKGFRLSSYAVWWVRASIQQYILHSWSLVKIGTTSAQRKLFFNLKRTREAIRDVHNQDELTPEIIHAIAIKLNVPPKEVIHMSQRMNRDHSLNAPLSHQSDATGDWIEWITDERENQEIILIQKNEIKKRRELLTKAFECLTHKERTVMIDRRLSEPPLPLAEVAAKLNLSRERIRQLENQAILKLQKFIRHSSNSHPYHI